MVDSGLASSEIYVFFLVCFGFFFFKLYKTCFNFLSVAKILFIASHGMFTCLGLKQHHHYSPPRQVILVFLQPPCHLFSVLSPH